jgi:excisionase family DNA binding protein
MADDAKDANDIEFTMADLKDSISVKEFSQLAHVSVRTVHRMIADGEIQAIHITRRIYRIPKRCVDEWLATRYRTSA